MTLAAKMLRLISNPSPKSVGREHKERIILQQVYFNRFNELLLVTVGSVQSVSRYSPFFVNFGGPLMGSAANEVHRLKSEIQIDK